MDQLFERDRWRLPVDVVQLEKACAEPTGENMSEFFIKFLQVGEKPWAASMTARIAIRRRVP